MRRQLSSLSHENLLTLDDASAATGIRVTLLAECVLAGDYAALTADQERRLNAWLAQRRAQEVFDRVMAAPALDLLRLFGETAE